MGRAYAAPMRTIVLGGSGHIGTYLIPRLVEAGHEVINVTRGNAAPYRSHAAWRSVRQVNADREDSDFNNRLQLLHPDVVIDLICGRLDQAQDTVAALSGRIAHFLHCGTCWVHGPSVTVPTTEAAPRHPFGEYGINKARIEAYLLDVSRRHGFPATVLHPGHITGPGWTPITPTGNLNTTAFTALARGKRLLLPNLGMETLHHVHADDVAQAFVQAMNHHSTAVAESFHVNSPAALTLRGYAETVASWYGEQANLAFAGWDEWRTTVSDEDARISWDHIAHSPNCSIDKAHRLLDYTPRYSSLQAIREALESLADRDVIPDFPASRHTDNQA